MTIPIQESTQQTRLFRLTTYIGWGRRRKHWVHQSKISSAVSLSLLQMIKFCVIFLPWKTWSSENFMVVWLRGQNFIPSHSLGRLIGRVPTDTVDNNKTWLLHCALISSKGRIRHTIGLPKSIDPAYSGVCNRNGPTCRLWTCFPRYLWWPYRADSWCSMMPSMSCRHSERFFYSKFYMWLSHSR